MPQAEDARSGLAPRQRIRIVGWAGAAFVLLLPLVAMEVLPEVRWSVSDFLAAGTLLVVAGLAGELLLGRAGSAAYRAGGALALLTGVLLLWIDGAVGIIGGEGEDANLLYPGVVALALLGACLARFRAPGMARAMAVAAVATLGVPAVALATTPLAWSPVVGVLTLVFVGLWLASAELFRRVAPPERMRR